MSQKMIELVFLRNHLLAGIFTLEDKKLMEQVKETIAVSDSPFKEIALEAIANCQNDIDKTNFKMAANEMNFIHNFHFNFPQTWNSNYFYEVELLAYLEKTNDISRIKKLIRNLANLQINLNI